MSDDINCNYENKNKGDAFDVEREVGGEFYKIAVEYLKYGNKDGKDNYTTEIVAKQMQLLGGRCDTLCTPFSELLHSLTRRGKGLLWL